MGQANVDDQRKLWTISEQLSPGSAPTITTEEEHRTLTVEEAAVEVKEYPFPYAGLFVVLQDPCSGKEYSLLIPKKESLTPRLASPDDSSGERVTDININNEAGNESDSGLTGTSATELGISVQ